MTIHIEEKGKIRDIHIPTRLLFNRVGAALLLPQLRRQCPGLELRVGDLVPIIREIYRLRRAVPDWVLVDVKSSSGERVVIRV